jgi:hypothetical protein
MGVCFCQKFNTIGLCQLAEAVNDFGCMHFQLVEGNTRNGEGDFEFSFVGLNHFQQQFIGRQEGFMHHLLQNAFIAEVVVIIMIVTNIEETISFEPKRLMNLEVEADGLHIKSFFQFLFGLTGTDAVVNVTNLLSGIFPLDFINLLFTFIPEEFVQNGIR